jgi:hypothetical protein
MSYSAADIGKRVANPGPAGFILSGVQIHDFAASSNSPWHYLSVGPDQRLYVASGTSCDVCARSFSNGM